MKAIACDCFITELTVSHTLGYAVSFSSQLFPPFQQNTSED